MKEDDVNKEKRVTQFIAASLILINQREDTEQVRQWIEREEDTELVGGVEP